MHMALVIGAVLSTLVGAGVTLCWMILIVAGMPNTSAEQQARMWRLFWTIGGAGIVCAVAASTLIVYGRPGLACAVGVLPLIVSVVLIVVGTVIS